MALFIRTTGLGRATVKIGIVNLAYNFRRLKKEIMQSILRNENTVPHNHRLN